MHWGAAMLTNNQLLSVAEDIEYFKKWSDCSIELDNATIRQGSAALRRLLLEDAAGKAWRQTGFPKSPNLEGPDLLALLTQRNLDTRLVVSGVAAGTRYNGIDTAFLITRRADNPTTGVPATAEEGFAVASSVAMRNAVGATPSDLDKLIHRPWDSLQSYLAAPGLIRMGETLSRREVIKHMANELGGVHIEPNTSKFRDLLSDAESKMSITTKNGTLRTFYIEVLAIGQAVGRSDDFARLAAAIRVSTN
jgi:hypothetical protein